MFDRDSSDDALRRIESLSAEMPARWGKMDGAQMCAHCCRPIQVALGDLTLKRALVGFLLGGLAKRYLVNGPAPFRPNMPTAPEFLVVDPQEFADQKRALVSLVRRLSEGGEEGLTRAPHPFFGRLQADEWDRLMWKHLDHHLRQFGA
ncbi:MAG: hypothetical protein ACI80N_004320 [Gammaproteobacteria bacterium]|jgi:hypothetical protein